MTKRRLYLGRLTRPPACACLGCGKILDAASGVGHRKKPRPGSISICLDCGHLQAFDGELKLRPLTDAEMIAIAGDKTIIAIQEARGHLQQERRHHET